MFNLTVVMDKGNSTRRISVAAWGRIEAEVPMPATQWRYRVHFLTHENLSEQTLDALGDDGWELCGMVPGSAKRLRDGFLETVHGARIVMKRPAGGDAR